MASGVTLKAAGLNISPNALELPAGSLVEAKNVIIRRDDVIESRRGFALYGTELPDETERAKQLFSYKQRILRHYSNKFQFQNGFTNDGTTNFDTFAGNYSETESGLRIKSIESNGNFYFTTSEGIKKISASSGEQLTTVTPNGAGVPKAIDLQARLVTVLGDQESFFTQNSVVAYRILWGKKDNNNNLLLGAPSESVQVYNPLTQLMIRDFNNILSKLDLLAGTSSLISDGNYAQTLSLDYTATTTELVSALNSSGGLFEKLDQDILYADNNSTPSNAPLTINSASFSNDTLTVQFAASSLSNYFDEGKNLKLIDFGNTNGVPINENYSIITIDDPNDKITFTINAPSIEISSITSTGIVTTATPHNLTSASSSIQVLIEGVSGSDANGIRTVGVISNTTQFQITSFSGTGTGTGGSFKVVTIPSTVIAITAATKIESNQYRSIPLNITIEEPASQAQLLTVQSAISECISRLQDEQSGVIPTDLRVDYFDSLLETTSSSVQLEFSIPDGIDSSYFYQIYRTAIITPPDTEALSSFNAGDEMALVYEAFPTAQELTNKRVIVSDETPDIFRGANLYTNPTTGEGILQANDQPPFAKDINTFKNSLFYANTKTKQRYLLSLIGVEQMIQNYDATNKPKLMISDGSVTNQYEFILGQKETTRITIANPIALASSEESSFFTLNSTNNETEYYVWYQNGSSTDPGLVGKTGIAVAVSGSDTGTTLATKTISALAPYVQDFSIIKSGDCVISNTSPAVITSNNHGLVNNQPIQFSTTGELPSPLTPATTYYVVNAGVNTFNVEATIGGGAINTTTNGSGTHSYTIDPSNNILIQNTTEGFCDDATIENGGLSGVIVIDGVGDDPSINSVLLSQSLSPAIAIEETARSLVKVINRSSTSNAYAYYTSGVDTTPGNILIEGKNLSDLPLYFAANNSITGGSFSPDLSPDYSISSIASSPVNVTISFASPAVFTTAIAHGLSVNDTITLSTTGSLPAPLTVGATYYVRTVSPPFSFTLSNTMGGLEINTISAGSGTHSYTEVSPSFTPISYSAPNTIFDLNFPCPYSIGDKIIILNTNTTPNINGIYTINNVSGNTFTVLAPANSGGTTFSVELASTSEFSSNEEQKHRIYYSKTNQPEAVPFLNYFDVGASDKKILRIFPLRDSLFVFKEDGLFRVSGESPPFVQALFDSSCIAIAPDSLGISGNLIYIWTTQGISAVSEAGVSLASRPIDTEVLEIASIRYTGFKTATFGTGYESDNSYIVWTVSSPSDTVATQAYRYSNLTSTWTKYDLSKTCAFVNPVDDRLYLGAADVAYIEQERKLFDRTDYADREFEDIINPNSYNNKVIKLNSIVDYSIGDVVVQNQGVTIYDFNSLLKKLDKDPGIKALLPHPPVDYFVDTFTINSGENLRLSLVNLATYLDTLGLSNSYLSTINTYGVGNPITAVSPTNPTVITTTSNHNLFTGRYVTIINSNSTRNIDGVFQITKISNNQFSIPLSVSTAGTAGDWVTDDQNYQDIKACFNKIIELLNSDTKIGYSNYQTVDYDSLQESVILSIDKLKKQITLNLDLGYLEGDIIIYKAIDTAFTYGPSLMGNPLSLKHMREATLMFINKQFTKAKLEFSTDLLPAFVGVEFTGDGSGLFGNDVFGGNFFGGVSHSAPFRTYIPRQCQRCRYLNVRFNHKIAREKYSILGITLTGETDISTRAYR